MYESFLTSLLMYMYLSHVKRKSAFCLCENKDADQLCSTAYQRLCFRFSSSHLATVLICTGTPVCATPRKVQVGNDRKWRNQKEIPTPQTEGWEKIKMTLRYFQTERLSNQDNWKGPQSDLSTVLSLNAVNFELVLFILLLNWPSLRSKKDRYNKSVQIHCTESNTQQHIVCKQWR